MDDVINMYLYESQCKEQGFKFICGVDEAGRGPLAGPVVAAAVILDEERPILGVNDSKKLSEKKRDALYPEIIEKAKAYGIGIATEEEIDQHNILQATFIAMRRAVAALQVSPDVALIDGNRDPHIPGIPNYTIIKGDSHSASIAAASILAKVTRDHMMEELHVKYPQYQLAKHKGYPTKLHYQLILEHGISPIHRKSFLKKLVKEHPELVEE